MAKDDEKDQDGGTGQGLGGTKLDRRDMLLGLSTVPALGLFGHAWNKQRGYDAGAEGGGQRRRGAPGHRRRPRSTWPFSAPGPRGRSFSTPC